MPNKFLTPGIIANEALMVLENSMVMSGLVHRDYSKEFVKVGDTITIRKPAKFIAKNFTGHVSAQDATEGSTEVKLDRFRDVTVNVTSRELTLNIQDFSSQVVTPAMQAIAQAVDSDLLAVGVAKAGKTITGTSTPTNLKDIGDIGKALDLVAAPIPNRRLVLHPTHKYRYALTDNMSKVSYAGDSQALREAELGRIYTMDTYMSQNAPDTLADAAGTATEYKVTATAGESKVALSDVKAATATVKKGDGFIVDGYMYRFAADAAAVSGAVARLRLISRFTKHFRRRPHCSSTKPTPLVSIATAWRWLRDSWSFRWALPRRQSHPQTGWLCVSCLVMTWTPKQTQYPSISSMASRS